MTTSAAQRAPSPGRTLLQHVRGDRLLLAVFGVSALLIGYQLTVTLLQPPWIKPATDWLRSALAWPQMLAVTWVALHYLRTQRTRAAPWFCAALGMLSYAVARTTWTIADVLIYSQGVPFPSLPDLFFILQYPFFITALFLVPAGRRGLPGLRTMLDAVLWMSAITALSWYFVLLPLSRDMPEPSLSKSISVYYQMCDLVLFYGLVVALTRPRRTTSDLLVICLLGVAVTSLLVADTWAAVILIYPPHTYHTGSWPDLFWFTFYLLVPLAALARMRLIPVDLVSSPRHRPLDLVDHPTWHEARAAMLFILPSLVVVFASALIILHATLTEDHLEDMILPELVAIGLLVLATLRPAVLYLEQERLRRERDAARIHESAMRLANDRMETYLSVVAHELKTPLTSLIGYIPLMARRLDTLVRLVRNHEDYSETVSMLSALIDWCSQSLQRMAHLVDDVLDETRVRQGELALRPQECDLVSVVDHAVAEQLTLNPERSIHWVVDVSPVPILADAGRIEQVVANFVSNALKFSRADQTVEVLVRTEVAAGGASGTDGADGADGTGKAREVASVAQVSVHDDGVGIPLADQPHIWEHFYQAQGVEVKSGSQVGFGIGLYVSKAIVEMHHGQVGVESAPGQGTTFWFTLPLASSPAPPHAASSPEETAHWPISEPGPGDHEHASD